MVTVAVDPVFGPSRDVLRWTFHGVGATRDLGVGITGTDNSQKITISTGM